MDESIETAPSSTETTSEENSRITSNFEYPSCSIASLSLADGDKGSEKKSPPQLDLNTVSCAVPHLENVDVLSFICESLSDKDDSETSAECNVAILRHLLNILDVDMDFRNSNGDSLLFLSLWQSQPTRISSCFIKAGANVNSANACGATPLHVAATENATIIPELIESGADINARELTNATPLHCAVYAGKLEAVNVLLYYGADVNIMDNRGLTPFTYLLRARDASVAEMLFNYYDDFSEVDEEGYTPLHSAIRFSSPLAAKIVKAGADVNAVTRNGLNPLELLLQFGPAEQDGCELFELIWSRLDKQFVLTSAPPFLVTYMHSSTYPTSEWIHNLYVILECSEAFDLLQQSVSCMPKRTENYTFLSSVLNVLHLREVDSSNRRTIISIFLMLGAEVTVGNIDFTVRHYGFSEELESLLYACDCESDNILSHSIVCAMSIFILAIEDETNGKTFLRALNRQLVLFRDETAVAGALGFFALSSYLKQALLRSCHIHFYECRRVTEKLLVVPEMPTLVELSRNQIRTVIRKAGKIKKPYQFYDAVRNINLPRRLEDVVLFRTPVY